MRVVQQVGSDAFLEKAALLQPGAQLGEIAVEIQDGFRPAPVKPGAGDEKQQLEPVRIGRIGNFLAVEFDLMNGRLDQVGGDALAGQFFERRQDEVLDGLRVCGGHILQTAEEEGVAVVGVETAGVGQRGAQFGFHQRLAQRRSLVAEKDLLKQGEHQHLERVLDVSQ